MKKITLNSRKIGKFLKDLNVAEFNYLRHVVQLRTSIQSLMKTHKVTKAQLCKEMRIRPDKFQDFITGNFNYDVGHLSRLNAFFMALETEKLKEDVPFGVKNMKN